LPKNTTCCRYRRVPQGNILWCAHSYWLRPHTPGLRRIRRCVRRTGPSCIPPEVLSEELAPSGLPGEEFGRHGSPRCGLQTNGHVEIADELEAIAHWPLKANSRVGRMWNRAWLCAAATCASAEGPGVGGRTPRLAPETASTRAPAERGVEGRSPQARSASQICS
jgi:hypothetical protein